MNKSGTSDGAAKNVPLGTLNDIRALVGAANDAIRAVTYADKDNELPADSILHCAGVTLDRADAMLAAVISDWEAKE